MHTNQNLDMRYDDPNEDPRYAEPPPKVVGSFPPNPTEREAKIQNTKYFLIAYCLVIFLFGGTILGIGIWMAVDRSFLTYIIGNDLYSVAIYMVLIGGGIVFFVAMLGCCGTITEHGCMILTFMGFLIFVFLVLFIGGLIGIVFRTQIGDSVQNTMEETLKDQYGVDLENWLNRRITEAWDRTQERLMCCAVREQGWSVYKETKWFEEYGAIDETKGLRPGYEDQKPYVPQSCCRRDRFYRYVNKDICQKWRLGPPGSPNDGAINRALYYEGCYDAALRYLTENSAVIIGLGISISLLLILGILLSYFLLKWSDKKILCFN